MNTFFPMTQVLNAAMNTREANQFSWGRSPRADVLEGPGEFRITMDLPGVSQADLDISLENQTLSVKANREIEVPEGFELIRHERPGKAEFHRTFNLGNSVDDTNIEATFERGVLVLTLPKSEQSLPRRIEVK
jgi:HSP20 family protein